MGLRAQQGLAFLKGLGSPHPSASPPAWPNAPEGPCKSGEPQREDHPWSFCQSRGPWCWCQDPVSIYLPSFLP